MSKLSDSLAAGKFTFTAEIGPPKGVNIGPVIHEAVEFLKNDRIAAVNVTDIQTAVMRASSMVGAVLLREKGIEPVLQMVCRDRNRLALQSDLLSASILGIENVLAITGDHVSAGDHKEAKPVYDLESVGLLQAMCLLEKGTDMGRDMKGNPNALEGTPKFFKGCVVTPCADEVEPQVIKLAQKVEAGAQFVQTQAVYDAKSFEKFADMARKYGIKVPILLGIVMLKNVGMAKYMNNFVPGVQVPDSITKRLKETDKKELPKVSAGICAQLINDMKGMCQGAHLMTLGWDRYVPDIIAAAGL